jgi:MerR family transcriptional regulator/heat shock protein HspR
MDVDSRTGLYGIAVAAELVGMAPQSLRMYEDRGLLQPWRTSGGTRRYSQDDVDRLSRIGELLAAGLNVAGIALVLELEARNAELQARLDEGGRHTGV